MKTKLTTGNLLLLLMLLCSACGSAGSDSHGVSSSGQQTAQKTLTQTRTATPTPEPDSDGDGMANADDYDPHNAKIQTKADASKCDVLGINAVKLREGSCTEDDGLKVKVVNKDTTLTLKQLSVHLNSIRSTDVIPQEFDSPIVGSFVVANITMTNRLSTPVETEAHQQFALLLGKRQYTPDFDAMNTGGGKLIYETVQPDESVTGDVVFRVAPKRMKYLANGGNLFVWQFSDTENFGAGEKPAHRLGIIRTYR